MEFSNAVLTSKESVICLCETWLNEDIISRELLLNNCDIYPREREINGDRKFQSASKNAVKNFISSQKILTRSPVARLGCRIKLNISEVDI